MLWCLSLNDVITSRHSPSKLTITFHIVSLQVAYIKLISHMLKKIDAKKLDYHGNLLKGKQGERLHDFSCLCTSCMNHKAKGIVY
jgi:hypothetical protein